MRRSRARTRLPRTSRAAPGIALAIFGLITLAPELALASPQFVADIDASCPTLRAEVLVRHLDAEADSLSTQAQIDPLAGDPDPVTTGVWQIKVRCEPAMVQIQVTRPATGARARRFVPAPESEDPQRERIVALATLPLLALARPEGYDATSPELSQSPTPQGPPPILPEPEPEPEPESEPEPEPEPEPAPAPQIDAPTHELQLAAGAGLGTRLAPLPLAQMELRYVFWPADHWGLGLSAGAALGSLPVDLGRVQTLEVPGRVDALWRGRSLARSTRAGGRVRLHLSAALGFELAYARLRGVGADDAIPGKRLVGSTGGPRVGFAGWLWPSPRVGLALELGGSWRVWAPVGQDPNQRKNIATTRGPMASLALRLAFDLKPGA